MTADGLRFEVKSSKSRRWTLPLWQLAQLYREAMRAEETPVVVFSDGTGNPSLALVRCDSVEPHAFVVSRWVSVPDTRRRLIVTTRIAPTTTGNAVQVAIRGHGWLLATYESVMEAVGRARRGA